MEVRKQRHILSGSENMKSEKTDWYRWVIKVVMYFIKMVTIFSPYMLFIGGGGKFQVYNTLDWALGLVESRFWSSWTSFGAGLRQWYSSRVDHGWASERGLSGSLNPEKDRVIGSNLLLRHLWNEHCSHSLGRCTAWLWTGSLGDLSVLVQLKGLLLIAAFEGSDDDLVRASAHFLLTP